MVPKIKTLSEKTLIGINKEMSLLNDKTGELWQAFMPRRNEIKNRINTNYLSMQIYGDNWNFSPQETFTKWAAVEVSSSSEIPSGMEVYSLKGGKYAVFIHKGPASEAAITMQYIFGHWFPSSQFQVDSREHFELLAETYNPTDKNAVEEIWIPIKNKEIR